MPTPSAMADALRAFYGSPALYIPCALYSADRAPMTGRDLLTLLSGWGRSIRVVELPDGRVVPARMGPGHRTRGLRRPRGEPVAPVAPQSPYSTP